MTPTQTDIDPRIVTRDYTTFPLGRYWLCDANSGNRLWDYETFLEARAAYDRCIQAEYGRNLVYDSDTSQVLICAPRRAA